MLVLAHIFGLPIEESLLPWLAGGSGAATMTLFAFNLRNVIEITHRRRK